MIKAGQLAQLQKDFKTCQDLTNLNDLKTFANDLQIGFMATAQYNQMFGNASNIRLICNAMMVADPYEGLVGLFAVSRIVNILVFLPRDID